MSRNYGHLSPQRSSWAIVWHYATIWAYAPEPCPHILPALNTAFTLTLKPE